MLLPLVLAATLVAAAPGPAEKVKHWTNVDRGRTFIGEIGQLGVLHGVVNGAWISRRDGRRSYPRQRGCLIVIIEKFSFGYDGNLVHTGTDKGCVNIDYARGDGDTFKVKPKGFYSTARVYLATDSKFKSAADDPVRVGRIRERAR